MKREEVEVAVKRIVAEELSMPPTQETEQVVGKRPTAVEGVTGSTRLGGAIVRIIDRLTFDLGLGFGGEMSTEKTVDELVDDIMMFQ